MNITKSFQKSLRFHFKLFLFQNSGSSHDATSVKRLAEFLKRCRQQLKKENNLFWVSLQSNLLADLAYVEKDFENAVREMQDELKESGWILPKLKANMRNQVNIANVKIQKGTNIYKAQSSIEKLKSGTSLIGEIPILFKVEGNDWIKRKHKVLKHCIDLMCQKSDNNIVVLYCFQGQRTIADDIKSVIKDKKVVSYPSKQSKEDGISSLKQFVEKSNYILVTQKDYFNGCESANIIFLSSSFGDVRNSALRGVQNTICIQLCNGGSINDVKFHGMKEDNRFF